MPRARRSGVYMSPAAVRIRSDVAMPTPISTSPASSAGTDDVRVASAFNAHPVESATNPTASTGRRPCRSIVRPAITAVTPDDVRKMAGPRPSSPAWPVTSTNVSVDTAAASCSTTELTALAVDRSRVFRRITGARSIVICRPLAQGGVSSPAKDARQSHSRDHGGRPYPRPLESGEDVLPGAGRDEARSRQLLPGHRAAADARPGRPSGADGALSGRRLWTVVLPEARAHERARLAADHDRADAQRHTVAGAGRGRRRPHRVGRQPRLHRPARVALSGGRPGPHR